MIKQVKPAVVYFVVIVSKFLERNTTVFIMFFFSALQKQKLNFCCFSLLFLFVSQAITVVVKNVKSNQISETQLQVLLAYAEEDIYDQSRQATAFGLLKVNSPSVFGAFIFMCRTNQKLKISLEFYLVHLYVCVSVFFRRFCPGSS